MKNPAKSDQWLDVLHVSNLTLNASHTEIFPHGMVDSELLLAERKSHFSKYIGWICMDKGAKAIGTLYKTSFAGRQIQIRPWDCYIKNKQPIPEGPVVYSAVQIPKPILKSIEVRGGQKKIPPQ